jgi:maleylacetate reductase
VVEGADEVLDVPTGQVPGLAAEVLDRTGRRPVVGLGGGRVVDVAKAVSAVHGTDAAAIPTTLAGSTFTAIHRLPEGVRAQLHRPSLAVCEPAVMVPDDEQLLAATAMNALAHAMESLYAPLANPVTEEAALRAAALFSDALPRRGPAHDIAEAAFLGGYAVGNAGLCVHHAVCQTIVRTCNTPHAQTNAVVLPHSARLMVDRAPEQMAKLADALGNSGGDPDQAAERIARLAAPCGHTRLSTLGVTAEQLPGLAEGTLSHPGIPATPDPPGEDELLGLLRAAL